MQVKDSEQPQDNPFFNPELVCGLVFGEGAIFPSGVGIDISAHETFHGQLEDRVDRSPESEWLRRTAHMMAVGAFIRQQMPDIVADMEATFGPISDEDLASALQTRREQPADWDITRLEAMEIIQRLRAERSTAAI